MMMWHLKRGKGRDGRQRRGETAKKGKDRHHEHSHFLEDMNQKMTIWIIIQTNGSVEKKKEKGYKTGNKITMDKEK